ncbi:MAG: hypothetical protein HYR91_13115 [Flavobacteriia bacterium]|nr:hypothetical protein [Flavobacteriia bacterium]
MSISKLSIFSKDTDAVSSLRGYNYQTLKTLESWIYNLLNNIDENIYCEYEEDIFQKNDGNKRVKFRQIKLYSSNFSFQSEEIKKCISHFFMLHIKSDYQNFDKEFIFETNSEISRKYLNNDADLLKMWYENQDMISQDQLEIISNKIKEICTEYIKTQKTSIIKEFNKDLIEEAINLFDSLDQNFWQDFTKLIKWEFIGLNSDIEFSNTKKRINDLLFQLPYDIGDNNVQQIFGVLLERVFTKASQKNSEERKLNSIELDLLILNIRNEEDKWYSQKYENYQKIDKIEDFRIGEFYEILGLINYCRRKKYLIQHKDKWNSLLAFYVNDSSIHAIFKRKAIYELIFLNNEMHEVDYSNLQVRERPKGNLIGHEDAIRFLFDDLEHFEDAKELENAQIILTVLLPAFLEKKVNISENELNRWIIRLYKEVSKRLIVSKDENEKCHLLEEKGNFLLKLNLLRNRDRDRFLFLKYFEEILENIDSAPLYKASQFAERINKYINIFINIDPTDKNKLICNLEIFYEKLSPYIEKREGKSKLAKQQIEKGFSFLKTNNRNSLLRALDYFHKAKDNYQQEDTIEGFVLALINIAQLYSFIGLYFAAKYYALCAFRISVNKEFVQHTESSLELMFNSDFNSGSWINALTIYPKYIFLRDQSNIEQANYEEEGKITRNVALILYTMQKKSVQYNYFIQDFLSGLGYIDSDIIKPIFTVLNKECKSMNHLDKILEANLGDFPLNDVGLNRVVNFYALGSLWEIHFDNDFYITPIAEEFISTIQIILAEISLSEIDFHLLKSSIQIYLKLSGNYKEPDQKQSNEVIIWDVFICHMDDPNPQKLTEHSVFNIFNVKSILNNISLLKQSEFNDLFLKFIQDRSLDSKQQIVNLYQRIHTLHSYTHF